MTGPPAVAPLAVGDPTHMGPYLLRGRIGAGGMGMVYLATDPTGAPVAVKIIRPEMAADPVFRDRFRREAAAAQRVPRFCTAAVRDVEPHGIAPYLVTDYIPGPTLSQAVREQSLSGADLEQLAIAIATALTMIHGVGVVHRDLKPGNVLLSPTGARVIDFGVAAAHDMTVIRGPSIGTPLYMAPEAFDGAPPSPAMDIWAWGGVVLFAATREPPFPAEPAALLAHRIRHDQPAHLHRLPGPLRNAVTTALSKDPAARPSATELYRMLTGPDPIPSTPTGHNTATRWVPQTVPPSHPWPPRPPTPVGPTPPPRAYRPRAIGVAAVTTTAVLAVILAVTCLRHPTRTLTAAQRSTAGQALAAAARTSTDPALAQRLAVAAWHLDPTGSATTLISTTAGRLPATATLAHAGAVTTVAASPTGQTLATSSKDHTARLWSTTNPDHPVPAATLPHNAAVTAVSLNTAGTLAATTAEDNTLHLWNIRDPTAPTIAGTYTLPGTAKPFAVAFDPTRPVLALTTTSGTLFVLDTTDPAHLVTLATTSASSDIATALFIPHTNSILITISRDGSVRLWDLSTPTAPVTISEITPTAIPTNLAISLDGRILATTQADGTVSLWDIHQPATPAALTTLTPPDARTPTISPSAGSITVQLQGMATAAAFNPAATLLAVGDDSGAVRLWDITDPHNARPSATLHAHTAAIGDLTVTPDGTHLITAGDDSTARLWNLTPASLYQRACATPTGSLTPQEWHRYLPHTPYQTPCP